jgi:uncharacterized iron-regulated membrane protein
MRWLYRTHRYLGIAVSALMLGWCLSGLVMLYVAYPSLPEAQRTAALAPLDLSALVATPAAPDGIDASMPIRSLEVEMLAGRAVARIIDAYGNRRLIDLDSGLPVLWVDTGQALAVAHLFARRWNLPTALSSITTLRNDQWTVAGEFNPDRPLYKISWDDPKASVLYISAWSGKAVQFTTASQRFWNWLGSVPHWVYFTALRERPWLWMQVVIVASLAGAFLTVTGIFIGCRQYWRIRRGCGGPYRGYMRWHHVPGLIFGPLLLMWVASGLLSLSPWGLLDGGDARAERARLAGEPLQWRAIQGALRAIAQPSELRDLVSLRSVPLAGELYFIGTRLDGHRLRLDARGERAALSAADLEEEARALGGEKQSPPELLHMADRYYFSHHSDPVSFPVYRLTVGGTTRTLYYLDPESGEILRKADSAARGYRWLHQGLHRLDFWPALRARPMWDVLMATLLAGATMVAATGLYSAARRLCGRRAAGLLASFVQTRASGDESNTQR